MKNEIMGAITEHWMNKRLRLHKPINLTGNLIKISAEDLLKLHEYKNNLLGINIPLVDVAQQNNNEQEQYLY